MLSGMTSSVPSPHVAGVRAAQAPDIAVDNVVPGGFVMVEDRHVNTRAMLRGLAADVGLPLLGYYVLHFLGVADWPALLAATALAAVRIVWVAVRERSLNLFATVMLVVFGLGVVLALVSGDARFLLLKNSIVTGSVGLVFLVTTLWGRPLSVAASESFQPDRREEIRREYDTNPYVRRGHKVSSTVWGAGLLLESLVRVPLIYLLPVSVMVGLGEALTVVVFAGLMAWTVWYRKQAAARIAAAERAASAEAE
jgi:hypothetical protein